MGWMTWYVWVSFLIYLPLGNFAIFYCLDLLIEKLKGRNIMLFRQLGITLSAITFVGLIAGMLMRNNIEVREVRLEYDNLPEEFDGMRIAHITDLHIACVSPQKEYLKKIECCIRKLNPDMLVFTGDMFNQRAQEGEEFRCLFNDIRPPLGKYAILGNHDYGIYAELNEEDSIKNMHLTREIIKGMGFTLLQDSSATVKKDSSAIRIVGTENCGTKLFACMSDLDKVKNMMNEEDFNILLTHDPSYWGTHVPKDLPYADLTLSGHTHAAQVGIELGNMKFSPSKWVYKLWDGLYSLNSEKRTQNLFISRGIGYVGIPFRLGMNSEIVIITLASK